MGLLVVFGPFGPWKSRKLEASSEVTSDHLRSSSAIGLKKYLDEKEIFRMDHYLAKTLVRPEGMDHYLAVV